MFRVNTPFIAILAEPQMKMSKMSGEILCPFQVNCTWKGVHAPSQRFFPCHVLYFKTGLSARKISLQEKKNLWPKASIFFHAKK
jgi:hypothetical protein